MTLVTSCTVQKSLFKEVDNQKEFITNKYGEPRNWIWAQIQGPYIGLGEIDGFIDPATFVDHRYIDRASDWDTYEVVELMDAWAAANPDKMVD